MGDQNVSTKVDPPFRFRLLALALAMLVLLVAVGWMAQRTSVNSADVRDRFQRVQRVSAWLGHRIRETVHSIDTRMLWEKLGADQSDWPQIQAELTELRLWLSQQRAYLNSPEELALLDEIDIEIDRYAQAAELFSANDTMMPLEETVALEVTELSLRSKSLVELGSELASAHQATVERMLQQSSGESDLIKLSTNAALVSILLIGSGMGWIVYRDSISPMRRSLLESRLQLARQEKLAALGELTTAISHEIRNPLTAVKARVFTLRKSVADDPEAEGDLDVISSEITRLERIVSEYLRFSRPPEPRLETVDPMDMLDRARKLLEPTLDGIVLRVEQSPRKPPRVQADADLIEQGLINLVRNAAQAIEASGIGGAVTMRVVDDSKNGWLRLEVEDDGPGIPAEAQPRLFDPFFTTKPNGTGLGLPLTARLLEKHGGRVEFRSKPNQATIFALVFPVQ